MSESDVKRRPLRTKSPEEKALSDNTGTDQVKWTTASKLRENSGLFVKLIDLDVYLTSKLALCTNKNAPLGFLKPLMILLEWSCHGVPWIAGTIVGILISHDSGLLQILLNLLVALLFDVIVTATLKITFRRKRPAHNEGTILLESYTMNMDKHSFPSGHASRAVMVALFIIDKFDLVGRLKLLLCIWMAAVPSSRILLGRHHVMDVLVGVTIGVFQYLIMTSHIWLSQQTCMNLLQPIHEDLHL